MSKEQTKTEHRHTNKAMISRGRIVFLAGTAIEVALADNIPDAQFICNAFNVTFETDLTPSQLQQENKELKEANSILEGQNIDLMARLALATQENEGLCNRLAANNFANALDFEELKEQRGNLVEGLLQLRKYQTEANMIDFINTLIAKNSTKQD